MPTYIKGMAIPFGPRSREGKGIEVTTTLISNIVEAPHIHDLVYPWPVDHLPARVEGSFQLSDLSNDVWCIYHILTNLVHPVLTHMMITIERAHCLYTLLTEIPKDFDSLVTSTMMSIWLTDRGIALPYKALITWITEYVEVRIRV